MEGIRYTNLVTAWILILGFMMASPLSKLLTGLKVSGVQLPLGFVPYVALVAAGAVLVKKSAGARWVATGILVYVILNAIFVNLTSIVAIGTYQFKPLVRIFVAVVAVVNLLCLRYLWRSGRANPYSLPTGGGKGSEGA